MERGDFLRSKFSGSSSKGEFLACYDHLLTNDGPLLVGK
jgi:hypothetical protein